MPESKCCKNVSSKKGKLSCCKCLFDQIKANLAKIQPENHQNVQRTHFWQKAPGVNGLFRDSDILENVAKQDTFQEYIECFSISALI